MRRHHVADSEGRWHHVWCCTGNMKSVRRGISFLPVFISWAQTSAAESSAKAAPCSQRCVSEPRLDAMLLCETWRHPSHWRNMENSHTPLTPRLCWPQLHAANSQQSDPGPQRCRVWVPTISKPQKANNRPSVSCFQVCRWNSLTHLWRLWGKAKAD